MSNKVFFFVATLASVALAGALSLTVLARGHGGQHHGQIAQVIEQLDLSPEQQEHVDRAHEILADWHGEEPRVMEALHERLLARFEQGRVDGDEIRQTIDTHLERMRGMAYAVTDELVALVNSLDADQREIVRTHLGR